MGTLTDVDISGAVTGETLVYNAANSKFEASTPTINSLNGGKF